jgi:hypothetical protein
MLLVTDSELPRLPKVLHAVHTQLRKGVVYTLVQGGCLVWRMWFKRHFNSGVSCLVRGSFASGLYHLLYFNLHVLF